LQDALEFISSNWALVTGNSDYISFVDDPFPSSSSSAGGTVLAVEFPEGSYAGSSFTSRSALNRKTLRFALQVMDLMEVSWEQY